MSPSLHHEPAQTQAPMPPERLAEIKSLLRYESSISFHSARAKESMMLLVAEVEQWRATYGRDALPGALSRLQHAEAEVERQAREIERLTAQIGRRDKHAGQLAECLVARTEELIAAEARPSLPWDASAVLLAKTLIEKFDDVVTATPVDATTLELNVEPADLARWQWWLNRIHAPAGQTTHRGSYATAKGEFGRTKVLLTGLSVGSLYAAERDRNGGAS